MDRLALCVRSESLAHIGFRRSEPNRVSVKCLDEDRRIEDAPKDVCARFEKAVPDF